MKKVFFILITSATFAACTSSPSATSTGTAASSLTMPFTALYSSKFSIGSDSNSLAVLNSYKAWEDGDMDALKNTFADSVKFEFFDGFTFNGSRDSLIKMAAMQRDSISKVELKMDAWIPLNSDDKMDSWVCAWYTEIDTYKTGKVDSIYYEDDNLLKNGKIAEIDSKMRKLK